MDKNRLNVEVNKTLESLNNVEKAELDDFFYVRLKARIARSKETTPVLWKYLSKPAVSLTGLSIAVLLNVFTITQLWKDKQEQSASTNTSIQSFASSYDLNLYSAYDTKQIER